MRRRLINQNRRDEVVQRIAQFVAANPTLANDPGVTFIRLAILDSKADDDMGEFDLSAQDLQLAGHEIRVRLWCGEFALDDNLHREPLLRQSYRVLPNLLSHWPAENVQDESMFRSAAKAFVLEASQIARRTAS